MKKLYLVILFVILQCCDFDGVLVIYRTAPEYDIDGLMRDESIVDLTSAWTWVDWNIEYKLENYLGFGIDVWQSAEETLVKRTGDCEDFSILLGEFLHRLGIESELVIGWTETSDVCHAILYLNEYDAFIEPQNNGRIYETFIELTRYSYDEYRNWR